MKYSVIIPTFNHCDDLLKPCVETLLKYSNVSDIELIISANGCTDDTFDYLASLKDKYKSLGIPENFKYVWSSKPLGYSRACNAGIRAASCNYIVLLNNDVVFQPQPKNCWLDLFENSFSNNTKCGISCVVKSHSDPAGHDFAIFFIVMIHKKVFEKIGLLNEEYGVGGGEDTEFCIEAERAGFEVCEAIEKRWSDELSTFTGSFPVFHKGEGTMHDEKLVPEWKRIFDENSLRLAKKYNRDWYKWAISNNCERGVFFKGDQVFPREKFRYTFAGENLKGKKVLEIGCSSGFGLQFLPEDVDYTGLDYEPEVIEAAKLQEWRPNAKFVQSSIHDFELECYDTIIAFETIEHIDGGLEVVERLKQYCNKLIISVPYNENPGQFSPHHVLHNLTINSFPDFEQIGLVDINGNLIEVDDAVPGIEYNLLMTWNRKVMNLTEKIGFMREQHEEIYKEITEINCYNIRPEHLEGKCVLDIGANIGVFSILAGALGAKRVVAVEPVGETFMQLCRNINQSQLTNIIPYKNVISDKRGDYAKISHMPNHGHNSMYNVQDNFESVFTLTLNDIMKEFGDSKDIVLKLDCEGAEYDILLTALQEDMDRVSRVVMEVHADLHPVHKGFDIIDNKMTDFGFHREDLKQVYCWDINEKGEKINWRTVPYRIEIWSR